MSRGLPPRSSHIGCPSNSYCVGGSDHGMPHQEKTMHKQLDELKMKESDFSLNKDACIWLNPVIKTKCDKFHKGGRRCHKRRWDCPDYRPSKYWGG